MATVFVFFVISCIAYFIYSLVCSFLALVIISDFLSLVDQL